MKKKVLSCFTASLMLSGFLVGKTVEIKEHNINLPLSLNDSKLIHNKKGFALITGDKVQKIRDEYIDSNLRNISSDKLDFVLGNKAKVIIDGNVAIFTRISDDQKNEVLDACKKVEKISKDEKNDIVSQLPAMSYIRVIQYEDGEIGLQLKHRLVGGGFWGAVAGAWAGKFIASAVCHTGIFLVGAAVSVVATPAVGCIVAASLETTLGTTIETTTTTMALAGTIAGGVMTGPI